jgi:tol-pal system protein YbgF
MKKHIISISILFLTACAANNTAVQQSLENINNEIINLQKTAADLRINLDETNAKISEIERKTETSTNSIANIKSDLAYFSNEVSILKSRGSRTTGNSIGSGQEYQDDSDIVIIEDELTDKNSLYTYAYEQYESGNYLESRKKFQEFLAHYPNDSLSDNALYWLAETYYSQKDYQNAINHLKDLTQKFPKGNKTPDALLKIALCYYEMGNKNEAINTINRLLQKSPNSEAAKIGRKKLNQWGM